MQIERSSTTHQITWEDDDDEPYPFVIHTVEDGHNSGKLPSNVRPYGR